MPITTEDVDAIASLPDDRAEERNLRISVAYGDLAEDFALLVDDRNLSWCTFGTWASEGVGHAIRHEQTARSWVLRAMQRWHPEYPDMVAIASQAFATGNRDVFDDIGRAFARFHLALREGEAAVLAFLDGLAPATNLDAVDVAFDPPVGLRVGFEAYVEVAEAEPARRAQLVYFANLCMAHVEQVRLQAPLLGAFGSIIPERLKAHRSTRRLAERITARLVTEAILELQIADEHFRPGRRLPALDGVLYPPDLDVLDSELFGRFDAVLPRGRRRAPDADDWTSLRDRLRYIGALMRSRQQVTALLTESPFTDEQRVQIRDGRLRSL
jgi:hypothetical protein